MRTHAQRVLLAPLAIAAAVALAACSMSSAEGKAERNEVIVGVPDEPQTVADPIIDGNLAGKNYYYNIFDQLTTFDSKGDLKPRLATSWTSNGDFTEWTFTLRRGVKFSNGDSLTADDVVFTYQTILANPNSAPRSQIEVLKSVEAHGDTVVFHLGDAFSAFPNLTASVSIVPKAVYEKLGSEGFAKAPVGSGPYMFEKYVRGLEYSIVRNRQYWGTKPSIDRVVFKTVADADARLNGVMSGSLDVGLMTPSQVQMARGNRSVRVESINSNVEIFLGANAQAGPLANADIRRAISLAIDRKALVKGVLEGRAVANSQVMAPGVSGYNPDYPQVGYDPKEAKRLIKQAGYNGEPITLEYASDGIIAFGSQVAQSIQGFLSKVGLNVTLAGMDQGSFENKIYGTVTAKGLYLNSYGPAQLDADPLIASMFGGLQNDYAKDPRTLELVNKSREVSGADRTAVFTELAKLNDAQGYIDGLYVPTNDYVVNRSLQWTARVDGRFVLSQARWSTK